MWLKTEEFIGHRLPRCVKTSEQVAIVASVNCNGGPGCAAIGYSQISVTKWLRHSLPVGSVTSPGDE